MGEKKYSLSNQDWRVLSNFITDVMTGRKKVVVISIDEEGILTEMVTGRKFDSSGNKIADNLVR